MTHDMPPIEVFDHLERQTFMKQYYRPSRPVILRDLSKPWPARDNWNMEYMRKRLGEIEVPLFKTGTFDPSAPVNAPHTRMRFSDYLDLFERGTDLRIFLLNPLKLNRSLAQDFSTPSLVDGFIHSFPTLFFGARDARVFLHYDIDMSHVFHTQFVGRKKVVLFAPQDSVPLYKVPFSVRSFMDNDPERIDFAQLPAMRYARGFEATLMHGDTLFIPSGWWHHMRYIDNGFALSQRAVPRSWQQRMIAANNLFLIRPLESALRKLGGESWRQFKHRVALRRGLALVRRMEALS